MIIVRSCLQVGTVAESWSDAQMICKKLGANLASIHNERVFSELYSSFQTFKLRKIHSFVGWLSLEEQ